MPTNNTVIGDITIHKKEGIALRIFYSTDYYKEYPYSVQVAPLFIDGTVENNWSEIDEGPGSTGAEFKSLSKAKKFIKWLLNINDPDTYGKLCSETINNINMGVKI